MPRRKLPKYKKSIHVNLKLPPDLNKEVLQFGRKEKLIKSKALRLLIQRGLTDYNKPYRTAPFSGPIVEGK